MPDETLFGRLFSLPWWWLAMLAFVLLDAGFILGWMGKCIQLNARRMRRQRRRAAQRARCAHTHE